MVRESRQELGEEAQEDGAARRAGESYHNTELQHQVCHHPQVRCQTPRLLFELGSHTEAKAVACLAEASAR